MSSIAGILRTPALALLALAVPNSPSDSAATQRAQQHDLSVNLVTQSAAAVPARSMELLPQPSTAADIASPPANARREPCGSASRLLAAGSGAQRAGDDDRVELAYTSYTRDGKSIDSSARRGEPLAQSVRNLAPGIGCVVKRMQVGEARRVWVPARLMLTPDDDDDSGDPKEDETIDITLVALTPAPPRPSDYAAPPPFAKRTSSGLSFRWLQRGNGQEHPSANSRVTIYHSGWTKQGVLFESSLLARHAASYLVYELPQGLSEGLQLMSAGDKARFWLPQQLAYARGHRSAPKGPVVFDVELLAIE
jgi:FKBP-type peptidyl-prolyl cis-trans isomerase